MQNPIPLFPKFYFPFWDSAPERIRRGYGV